MVEVNCITAIEMVEVVNQVSRQLYYFRDSCLKLSKNIISISKMKL